MNIQSAVNIYNGIRKDLVFPDGQKSKWTYIIHDYESGMSKIGISADPLRRARECKAFRPRSVLFLLHTRNIEQELHKRFKDKYECGEWYRLDENDFNDLICLDGFRYMYGLVDDNIENDNLYVVQPSELKQAKQSCKHYENYECCQQLYGLWLKYRYKTVAVKKANEFGIRTPSGFAWKVPFGSKVIDHINKIKKGGNDE